MNRFKGRVAFVTGAGRGIGKGVAFGFAEEGAKVCLIDMNEKMLNSTVSELKEKGFEVTAFIADVSDNKQVEGVVGKAINQYGKIGILVNNAGVLRDNLIFKMQDSDWETIMNVHLKGSFNCARKPWASELFNCKSWITGFYKITCYRIR